MSMTRTAKAILNVIYEPVHRLIDNLQTPNAFSDFFFFCCLCEESQPSSLFTPVYGPVLIIVPLSLMANWTREWNNSVFRKNNLDMQFRIGHGKDPQGVENDVNDLQTDSGDESYYGQERFVILTTSRSYEKQVENRLAKVVTLAIKKTAQRTKLGVKFSLILRDECSDEKGWHSTTCRILRRLKREYFKNQ